MYDNTKRRKKMNKLTKISAIETNTIIVKMVSGPEMEVEAKAEAEAEAPNYFFRLRCRFNSSSKKLFASAYTLF